MAKKYPYVSLRKMKRIELLALADIEGLTVDADIHHSKLASLLSKIELPSQPPPVSVAAEGAPPQDPNLPEASVRIRRIRQSHGRHYG